MKNRMQKWVVAGLFLVAMTGLLPAGEILASFSGKTLIVAKVNFDKVKQVPPIHQALASQISNIVSFLGQIRQFTGVDLQTVKTVWFGQEKKDYAVIVLEGAFSVDAIRSALAAIPNAQMQQMESVPLAVLMPDDKHPGKQNLAAVLNASTLVIGPPELVEAFVDNYTGVKEDANTAAPQALSAENQKKIAGLKESQDLIRAIVIGLEPEQMQQQPFLAYLKGAELQGDLAGDLVLKLTVDVAKPEMVEPLQKLGEGLLGFAKQMDLWSKSQQPPPKDQVLKQNLLNNATVAVADGRVVVSSKLDEAILNEVIGNALNAIPAQPK